MFSLGRLGFDLIQRFESCKDKKDDGLIYPYLDAVGIPTIGWGSTYWLNGDRVKMTDSPINQATADSLFASTLHKYIDGVNFLVKSSINQNQFDALVSFAYNVGLDLNHNGIAEGLGESTLLRKVNTDPSDKTIQGEFMKWDKASKDGQLITLPGLTIRRNAESHLYFS